MEPELTVAELVMAIGSLCRDEPNYWHCVIASLVKEGIVKPMPATRRGTGIRRRFTLTEVRIVAILCHLKAAGLHHLQVAHVAQILRNGLEDMPSFRERWEAAADGKSFSLYIAPANPLANRGFGSDELPYVQMDSDSYFRKSRTVIFKIELANVFREMELPEFEGAET
jgi:hypothetical protein